MELAIYGVGCLFSSIIRQPECVQPGRGVHDYLRVPTLTALPRSHAGLAGARMDRET